MSLLQPKGLWSLCYVFIQGIGSDGLSLSGLPIPGSSEGEPPLSDVKEVFLIHFSRMMKFNSLILQIGKLKPSEVMTCPRLHCQFTGRGRTKTCIFRVRSEIGWGLTMDIGIVLSL